MTKLSKKEAQNIRVKLPSLLNLVRKEDSDYQLIFVSVFDHWLTQDEFEPHIHTEEFGELQRRRDSLQKFIVGLFDLVPTFSWRYKRKKRIYLYRFETLNQILKKCDLQNQNSQTGQRYDILIPDLQACYSEEWDWTNCLWFRNEDKIKPLIELAKNSGLYILEKTKHNNG
ncbi:MAG: hypothetical protein RH860_11215 [Cytophagales bacterium]